MRPSSHFFVSWGLTMAAAMFFVAGVAFATTPWNLGQHPGEVPVAPQGTARHMT